MGGVGWEHVRYSSVNADEMNMLVPVYTSSNKLKEISLVNVWLTTEMLTVTGGSCHTRVNAAVSSLSSNSAAFRLNCN